jgi:uncharacterized protein (TIGR03083 family)
LGVELARTQVIEGVLGEYDRFGELLAGMTPDQWTTATRCDSWEVRDVAGHVVGLASDVVAGTAGKRTPEDQARELRTATGAELAERLRDAAGQIGPLMDFIDDAAWAGPSPVDGLTMADAVHGLWFDTYVHADDIRQALGLPSDRGPGLGGSIAFLAYRLRQAGWGPARIALDGVPAFELGGGDGPRVEGDPLRFLLAGTGRTDPAEVGLDETVNIYR